MNNKITIGFGHKRLVGKDTSCDYLVKSHKIIKLCLDNNILPFQKDSFAHSLKEGIGKGVFGLTEEQMLSQELKSQVIPFWEMSPRQILQLAGTDAMRNVFGPDIWVKTLQRRQEIKNNSMVVADVRFKNEALSIKKMGGYLIKINRVDGNCSYNHEVDNHPSEVDLDDYECWDYIIDNDSTIPDLYEQLDSAFKKIVSREKKKYITMG